MGQTSFSITGKAAALLEVVCVFIAGSAVARYLEPLTGVAPPGKIVGTALAGTNPDFVGLSAGWLKFVFLQYACLLLPAFAIGWWRRRYTRRYYGITRAGHSTVSLLVLGLVTFALVALPLKLLWVGRHFFPLDQQPAFWVLADRTWTPAFWLFLAVSSFAVTPVFEELFFRGYCQSRLEEAFGGIGAVVIVTLFMTLGHNQYFHPSLLSLGTLATLLPLAFGMGYLYLRTRSLVPSIILHVAVNLPTKGIYDYLLPVAMIAGLICLRKKCLDLLRDVWQRLAEQSWKLPALVAAIPAVILLIGFEARPNWFIPLAGFGLLTALFFDALERCRPVTTR